MARLALRFGGGGFRSRLMKVADFGQVTPGAVTTEWRRLVDFAAGRGGAGGRFALATLVGREGASYRQPGARLVIGEDGRHAGCLSGGCLEDAVAEVGTRVLRTGTGERLRVDTRPHFGCPGVLDIQVEVARGGLIGAVGAALAERRRGWLVTGAATGTVLVENEADAAAMRGALLVQELGRLPRLIVASATSDADELCGLAAWMGWEVRRVAHAAEARSAGGAEVVMPERLGEVLREDERTACVVMTHHLGRDLAYLRAALAAGYPYVGLLGSRSRREALLGELGALGMLEDEAVLARLRAPVGLDLGADEPRAIALAIVAEIQAAWAGTEGGALRDKVGRLHGAPA